MGKKKVSKKKKRDGGGLELAHSGIKRLTGNVLDHSATEHAARNDRI